MKKILKIVSICLLTIFSFFYTNKMIDVSKNNDPIMKKIIEVSDSLKISSVNASIDNDYLILGKSGIEVDVKKSYEKMKKLGEYNENLIVYKEISTGKYTYDKFIINGNKKDKTVSIVFTINNSKNIYNILEILKNNNIKATFFIDGKWGAENSDILNDVTNYNHVLAGLSYDNLIDKNSIVKVSKVIEKYNKNEYCYTKDDNYKLLNVCKELKLFTIKPIEIEKDIYLNVKEKIDKGVIFSFNNKDNLVKELDVTIKYILQKGYKIILLDKMIN